jgi:hypothetical protein
MPLAALDTVEAIEVLENYLSRNRPPEHIRNKLDIGYRIENQSVYLFEIRPDWQNPNITRNKDFAKTTFVKGQKVWKVYWLRADLKWHPYDPKPQVRNLSDFIKLVEEDKHACFKG